MDPEVTQALLAFLNENFPGVLNKFFSARANTVAPSAQDAAQSIAPPAPSAHSLAPSAQPSAPSALTAAPLAQPSAPSALTSAPSAQPSAPSAHTTAPANTDALAVVFLDPPRSPDADLASDMECDAPVTSKTTESDDSSDGFQEVNNRKKKRSNKGGPPAKRTTNEVDREPIAAPSLANPSPAPPSQAPERVKTPPPVYIRDKGAWPNISAYLDARNIVYKARTTKDNLRVQVNDPSAHRTLTSYLRAENIGGHSYPLPEERKLRAVIKNIPKEIDAALVESDLKAQGFPVCEVFRMFNRTTKAAYDMVLAVLDLSAEGKRIFKLTRCCKLSGLKVETPASHSYIRQCHRCQLYGHSARNCFARPRCVKCLGDHGTEDCLRTLPNPEPPSCVLCGKSGHPANYRGCSEAPKHRAGVRQRGLSRVLPRPAATNQAFIPAPVPTTNAWARPLSMVTNSQPSVAPAAAPPSATQALALAPTPHVDPSTTPAPPVPTMPTPELSESPAELLDAFRTVKDFLSTINTKELISFARSIRESANNPEARVEAAIRHFNIVQALCNPSTGH